jgi:hypothetical protein
MILVMMFPFPSATSALTDASHARMGKPSVKQQNARKIRVFLRSGDKRQQKALSCGGKKVGLPSDVAARGR